MSEADWEAEFAKYKASPEYLKVRTTRAGYRFGVEVRPSASVCACSSVLSCCGCRLTDMYQPKSTEAVTNRYCMVGWSCWSVTDFQVQGHSLVAISRGLRLTRACMTSCCALSLHSMGVGFGTPLDHLPWVPLVLSYCTVRFPCVRNACSTMMPFHHMDMPTGPPQHEPGGVQVHLLDGIRAQARPRGRFLAYVGQHVALGL